jgi:hypothetical protein
MYRMPKLRMCDSTSFAYDLSHGSIHRDCPSDFDRPHRHAAPVFERFGGDLGPDHDTVKGRVARGHSKREWIGRERRLCPDRQGEKPVGSLQRSATRVLSATLFAWTSRAHAS